MSAATDAENVISTKLQAVAVFGFGKFFHENIFLKYFRDDKVSVDVTANIF